MNQWGSKGTLEGTDSKGKACGDVRNYVAMEMVDGETKLYQGRCSSTATKYFDKHVMSVASKYQRPIRGVITRLGWDANNSKVQVFSDLGPAANDVIMEAQGKLEEARRMLSVEPTFKVAEAANDAVAKAPAKRAGSKR